MDEDGLLDSCQLSQPISAAELDKRIVNEGEASYRFLLVMPRARQDLSDALSHYRFAGRNQQQVQQIGYQIAGHLQYLNEECARIHGDLKPRNVIQLEVDTDDGVLLVWVLIDLDASCAIGALAGQKVTSSAYFPPEMARRELSHADQEVVASIGFEMWYFGCLLYELCTEDAETLWKSTQADNIDTTQLEQLAHQWSTVKGEKMAKIVWPQARHLAEWLLQEDVRHRPQSWDQVMQHPFLVTEAGPATHKRVVMSCPEDGTINPDGSGPYDQKVMEKVSELQQIGYVKFGFDRAGTSTAREKDAAIFERAFELRNGGDQQKAVALLKSTDWWYGYQTSVKQAVKLECQGFNGELDVICVQGGFITQLEAAEMGRIMSEATSDCLKSGITVKYKISEVSYYEFLSTYGPALTCGDATGVVDTSHHDNAEPETETEAHGMESHHGANEENVATLKQELAAKDEELTANRQELTAKDEELTAKDKELTANQQRIAALEAQLQQLQPPKEGVPPV